MIRSKALGPWYGVVAVFSLVLLALSGCGGSDGAPGPQGVQGPPGPPGTALPSASQLNFVITGVTIASPPVVNFSVTNEDGLAYARLSDSDLRFNISKLIPGTNGDPSQWQNYIVSASNGAMRGSQERFRGRPTDIWGALDNHGDGTYTYTFETDLATVAANCPAPCTEADGKPLDLSYQPGQVHRVTIQQGNRDLPLANVIYDFVPATGPVASSGREIVKTDSCNQCHDKITAHGSRFETRLCVTCHNPGSWADEDTTVDFKVMIHKIHRGEHLPSVVAGGSYAIGGHDFSDIGFPQDIRNCTKCHDGSDPATPQGDNWTIPSMAACGSCHDDIDFSKDGTINETTGLPNEAGGHPGGIVSDNSECLTCHAEARDAGSVAQSHTIPGKVARAFFKFNILEICGTPVANDPSCPPGTNPTVKFSVTDPTGATTHTYGNAYNIRSTSTDQEFSSSDATLNILVAWDTRDYTNEGGTGTPPARADSVNLRTSAAVIDNTDGTFTLVGANVTPNPLVIPAAATGTGTIGMEGHPAAESAGAYTVQVPVNSEVAYFSIDEIDGIPKPRRQVVDVPTKCDRCHDVLNVHGSNRNNNGQLCVMCHNPSNTDVGRRPKDAVTGLPLVSPLDGKTEESIDFKRLIHGIHSAAASNFDGTQAHGFRETGLVIYGFNGSVHDFSHIRFPGVLSKCETCHLPDTYTLADRSASGGGNWEYPVQSGIQGSTVHTYPKADPGSPDYDLLAVFNDELKSRDDDYKYSPIASACSSCHDGALSKAHMSQNGALFGDRPAIGGIPASGPDTTQPVQEDNALAGNFEGCPVCHGPGKIADVKLVHDAAFAAFLGEITAQ